MADRRRHYYVRVRIEIVDADGDTVNHRGYYDAENPWRTDVTLPGHDEMGDASAQANRFFHTVNSIKEHLK
jgi:hypothetical protein